MIGRSERSLTEADKTAIFKSATRGLERRYHEAIRNGMTDKELKMALSAVLGIFGGSGGPLAYSITFTGSGLRIWGSWNVVNHAIEKPLFAGKATIAKARAVYSIANPEDDQLGLF